MTTKRKPSPLRRAREGLGLSQQRVATAAGISLSWLRLLERDPSLLTDRVASRLLPVLGLAAQQERA